MDSTTLELHEELFRAYVSAHNSGISQVASDPRVYTMHASFSVTRGVNALVSRWFEHRQTFNQLWQIYAAQSRDFTALLPSWAVELTDGFPSPDGRIRVATRKEIWNVVQAEDRKWAAQDHRRGALIAAVVLSETGRVGVEMDTNDWQLDVAAAAIEKAIRHHSMRAFCFAEIALDPDLANVWSISAADGR